MTTFKKETRYQWNISIKKIYYLAKFTTTVHDMYWPLAQAWHVNCPITSMVCTLSCLCSDWAGDKYEFGD